MSEPLQRFALPRSELWQLDELGFDPLIEKVSPAGMVEGMAIRRKPLPLAVKQALIEMGRK